MQTAIISALIIYVLTAVISVFVACMIKLIFWCVRASQGEKKP